MNDLRPKIATDLVASIIESLSEFGELGGAWEYIGEELREQARARWAVLAVEHLEERHVETVPEYLEKYPHVAEKLEAVKEKLKDTNPGEPWELDLWNENEQCHTCGEGQFLVLIVVHPADFPVEESMARTSQFDAWLRAQSKYEEWECQPGRLQVLARFPLRSLPRPILLGE